MSVTSGQLFPVGHRARGSGASLRDIPALETGMLLVQNRGRDFYVDSVNGNANNSGTQWGSAFATLAQAHSIAAAGDRIHIAPGHTESLASAAAITISKSGLTIIGYGRGNQRPTFTWTATAATFVISGADNTLFNILTKVDIDEVVSMFSVTGARNQLLAVDFQETTAKQAIQWLTASAAATELEIAYCRHIQATAAAATQIWINLTGVDRAYIHHNTIMLTLRDAAAGAVVGVTTTQCLNVEIAYNQIKMTGFAANLLSCFLSLVGTTGLIHDNFIGADVAANTTINDMPGCYSFQNLCTNAVDKSGILDPIADT